MNDIKEKITNLLKVEISNKEKEHLLQQINALLLSKYMLSLSNGLNVYPLEVEAYLYDDTFKDIYTHKHDLQRNRFGKLYFHRYDEQGNKIKCTGTRGGVDICLSAGETYHFGVLIRAGKIMFKDKLDVEIGPNLLANYLINSFDQPRSAILEAVKDIEKENVLTVAITDPRDFSYILHSSRIGLGNPIEESNQQCIFSDSFVDFNLRNLIELSKHPYEEKERTLKRYFDQNNLWEKSESKRKEIAKKILNYVPKWVYE